jgi:hypothetical protein
MTVSIKTISITAFSIMAISMLELIVTPSIKEIIMTLSIASKYRYAEYIDCILGVFMPGAFMIIVKAPLFTIKNIITIVD